MQRKAGVQKLLESALYRVTTRRKLADILLCSVKFLETLPKNADSHYRRVWKPKNDIGVWLNSPPPEDRAREFRPIDLASPDLKRVQTRVAKLLSALAVPDFIFSPVKGRSYVDNAAAHLGARAFWMLDIDSYFPSCREHRVVWFFRAQMQCSPDVAAILAQLTCYQGALPQGSPCSPVLSYFSNMNMWAEISDAVTAYDCKLSVYADDITLSGNVVPKSLVWSITEIAFKNGFTLSAEKGHSLIDAPANITGVIVHDGQLLVPNRQLKKLRELKLERKRTYSPVKRRTLENRIAGTNAQQSQIRRRSPATPDAK